MASVFIGYTSANIKSKYQVDLIKMSKKNSETKKYKGAKQEHIDEEKMLPRYITIEGCQMHVTGFDFQTNTYHPKTFRRYNNLLTKFGNEGNIR